MLIPIPNTCRVHALVERCAADGRATDVERCVLALHAGVLAHANP